MFTIFVLSFLEFYMTNTQATPFFIHVDPYFTFLGVGHQGDARCPPSPRLQCWFDRAHT